MEQSRKELFKYLGIAGLFALIGGLLHVFVTDFWGKLNLTFVIIGALLCLIYVAGNFQAILAGSQTRSSKLGANSALLTIGAIAIFAFVNFLGYRHHKKIDLTAEKLFTLSDQTKKVVTGLKKDIRILHFNKTDEGVGALVEQYRDLNTRIIYERVDLQARPELAQQFRGVKLGETAVMADKRSEKIATLDEQSLTSAIVKVTREQAKTVYFVEGHGEHELAGGGPEGYQQIGAKLKADNYDTKTLNLVETNKIPDDCSVLILAGPKKGLLLPESDMIKKYLNDGGKVLVAIDPDADPTIAALVADWNIEMRKDTVVDTSGVGRLFGTGPAVPLVVQYGSHPITKDFSRNTMTFYPLARSIKAESKADITITELLKSSPQSFGETELQGNEAKLDEGKDAKGPLTLGVAATKKAGEKEARLVVIGDSDFATNSYQNGTANGDFFVNSVNWLAQEEDLISIRPKSQTNRSVEISDLARNLLLLVTFAMPLAIIAGGFAIWWKRR